METSYASAGYLGFSLYQDLPLISPPVIHSICFPAWTSRHPGGIRTCIRLPVFRAQTCTAVSSKAPQTGWTGRLTAWVSRLPVNGEEIQVGVKARENSACEYWLNRKRCVMLTY